MKYIVVLHIAVSSLCYSMSYDDHVKAFREGVELFQNSHYDQANSKFGLVKIPRIYAKDYFYYYRAESVRKQKSIGVDKLKDSLDDYSRALNHTRSKQFRREIKQRQKDALRRLIQLDSKEGRPYSALRWIQKLGPKAFHDGKILETYVVNLLKTKQFTAAKQLLNNRPELAKKASVKKLLPNGLKSFKNAGANYKPWSLPSNVSDHPAYVAANGKKGIKGVKAFLKKVKEAPYFASPKKAASYLWRPIVDDTTNQTWEFVKGSIRYIPAKVLYNMVDPLWDRRRFSEAKVISEYLLENFPALDRYDRLLYVYGRLHQDLNDFDSSIKYFKRNVEESPAGTSLEASLFNKAFSSYHLKNSSAIADIKEYLRIFPDGSHATGARYMQYKLTDKKEQEAIWKDIQYYYPLSFYTLKIRQERGLSAFGNGDFGGVTHPALKDPSLLALGGEEVLVFQKVKELENVGLMDWAGVELQAIGYDKNRPVLMLYVADWLEKLDVRGPSINYFTRLATQSPKIRMFLDIKNIVPRYYFEDLKKALSLRKMRYKIDPYLVLSLTRQESAFNEKAVSSADARGLMQLLPKTAKNVAKTIKFSKKIDLFDPQQNMLMGTALITQLLTRYEGKTYLALAAYNAGPGPVNRWIKARGHLPPLDFVEAIPYKETRFYVLTIMRNYLVYHAVYNGTPLNKIKVPWQLPKNH